MRKQRRRKKYTWFPGWGNLNPTTSSWEAPLQMVVNVGFAGPTVGCLPLIRDFPEELDQTTDASVRNQYSLADVIGSEYFVKRIVGKLFVNVEYDIDEGDPLFTTPAVLVKTGVFVAAADSNTPDVPRDFATEYSTTFNPLSERGLREPWMFQRSWILGTGGPIVTGLYDSTYQTALLQSSAAGAQRSLAFPPSNVHYGSMSDGPHIDIKTARRVRQEERLYWVVSVLPYPTSQQQQDMETIQVRALFDARILGGLRKATQRGAF